MRFSGNFSKVLLISHVILSIGWFGAVVVFLILAIIGLTTLDIQIAQSVCVTLELITLYVIVPFCISSFATGVAQATLTKWGLLKHYWIVVKLILTVLMTILLFVHLEPISALAQASKSNSFSNLEEVNKINNLISKSGAAVIVLILLTTISMYKPWGKIEISKNDELKFTNMVGKSNGSKKPMSFYLLIALTLLILVFIVSHLLGGGMHGH